MVRCSLATLLVTLIGGLQSAHAGLHYSGETLADLPSQWRGFLLDQRTLRNIAVAPGSGAGANPARARYQEEAGRLQRRLRDGRAGADDLADLGAVHLRLGETAKALEMLRAAYRQYPRHFRIVSNLGTAWQYHGDLGQAV